VLQKSTKTQLKRIKHTNKIHNQIQQRLKSVFSWFIDEKVSKIITFERLVKGQFFQDSNYKRTHREQNRKHNETRDRDHRKKK